MLRTLLSPALAPLALVLLGLTGCSSTSGDGDGDGGAKGEPLRVTYHSFNTGQELELVSEAHTTRLEQYSEVRADANRKVQTDEVMQALVKVLDDYGFYKYAQEGSFPAEGAGRYAWALQIERPDGAVHVLAHPGLSPEAVKDLQRYMIAFVDTYNATYGLQAVDVEPGEEVFKTPTSNR